LIQRVEATRDDLEHNHRLLARADKLAALGRVSAGVAHEIRNPLTAIKVLIYSMRTEPGDEAERQRDLEVIAKEVDRMERFVDSFLRFARPPEPTLQPIAVTPSCTKPCSSWHRVCARPGRRSSSATPTTSTCWSPIPIKSARWS
jgi:signal transduction histidine kinase